MAKLDYSIALNLITNGVKTGAKKVETIFAGLKRSVNSLLGSIGVGIGIGAFTSTMVQQTKEFQEQMAHIKGATNGTAADMKSVEDAAIKMGSSTNYSATEAATGMAKMAQNGISAADATKILATTLEFAEAHSIDTSRSAEILTNQLKAFGMAANEANAKKVADVLSIAAPKTGGIENLVEALQGVAPVARTANIGIEDVASAIVGLTQSGVSSGKAGTTIMQFIARLAAQTPKATQTLRQYGVQVSAASLQVDGLSGTMRKLAQSGIGSDANALANVFGRRAYTGVATLIANYQKVMQANNQLQSSNGTTSRMAEDNSKTIEGAINGIKASWNTLQVKLGQSDSGALNGLFQGVRNLFSYIVNNARAVMVQVGVIFAGTKAWNFFKNWSGGSRPIIAEALKLNGELASIHNQEASLEKKIAKQREVVNKAADDQIMASRIKLNDLEAQLDAKRTIEAKMQSSARVATERAEVLQNGTAWQAFFVRLQVGAAKVGAAFKSLWSSAGPMIAITAITEIGDGLINLYRNHVRVRNMAAEYTNQLKLAEQQYSPQLNKLEILKTQLNNSNLTVTQHRNIVNQINGLLGTRITNEKDLNRVLSNRIDILKQSADIEFYENKRLEAADRMRQIRDKWGGDPNTHRGDFWGNFFKLSGAKGKYSVFARADDKDEYNELIRERNIANNYLNNAAKNGKLVTSEDKAIAGGGGGFRNTQPTGTTSRQETAAERAAKESAQELAEAQSSYSDSLKKLNWEYQNGYIKESDYLSQVADLTKETFLQTQTSKYARNRNSQFAVSLQSALSAIASGDLGKFKSIQSSLNSKASSLIKALPNQETIKFKQIQEQLNEDLQKYDNQLKSGAINIDDADKGKQEAYANAFRESGALNLTPDQTKTAQNWRDQSIYTGGGQVVNSKRDSTFDYELSPIDKLQAKLEDANSELEQYTELNKQYFGAFQEQINKINLQKLDLGKAIKVEKFKQDIREAKRELVDDASSIVDNIDNISYSWENVQDVFKNSNESVFKKALTIFESILQTIRSVEQVVDTIKEIRSTIEKMKGAETAMKAIGGIVGGKNGKKDSGALSGVVGKVTGAAASKLATKTTDESTKSITKEAIAAKNDASAVMELASAKFFLAEADKGLPGAGLGAAATAIMVASVATAKPFAQGGIIDGKPFDGSIAKVSGGEMIINAGQQGKLWNAISSGNLGGNGGGEITVRIHGRDLVGVLNNQNNKMRRAK
ncbi:MAG: phage tail tape measure protein [Prevotella sp.]|jgi:TP901 family phage tail tape measure protein|nr:phage tail tape measure protein [Prevotella sp.]MCH3994857.1 phage tail tape measure protein [Prevotella sp.]